MSSWRRRGQFDTWASGYGRVNMEAELGEVWPQAKGFW